MEIRANQEMMPSLKSEMFDWHARQSLCFEGQSAASTTAESHLKAPRHTDNSVTKQWTNHMLAQQPTCYLFGARDRLWVSANI